ncbi:beta-1,3-galactosyl-O-glycosyl-glycoprotein beta-1,6-N-acetylglucosaminyltransferase 3 [Genypterus blacodes]|uniref:beta-1,3-galactosyl-O-glycosyl-glycoprotein beta-1,6-N-acetylglucosaminyltransferase 3 n=1 Tax=Genypterus blacodes TaxID=154954 RepID=UPI003F76AD7E
MSFARFLRRWSLLAVLPFLLTGTLLVFVLWQTRSHWQPPSELRLPQEYARDLSGCLAVIKGDVEDRKGAVEELLSSKRQVLSEEFYLNITQDCHAYIERRGFLTVPLSVEEKDFPLAYSMVIHEKIDMFERLLRAIYVPQNIYCVHVDKKSSEDFKKAVQAIVSCFPNVFVASKLESVVYASWSRVQADLHCLKDLLRSPVQWRYLLNTCGADFPLKTNAQMVSALKGLHGKNSMESEVTSEGKKRRWQYHYNVTNTVTWTDTKKSPPPISSPMFSGNAYFVASRDFVRHVLEDEEVQGFMKWEEDTYSPDEHMWATLMRMPAVPGSVPINSKYDLSDMLSIARLVKWSYLAGNMAKGAPYGDCTGVYRRAVCVYGAGDLPWIIKQHHLFANKFDQDVDDLALRCLESYLRFKALSQSSLPGQFSSFF